MASSGVSGGKKRKWKALEEGKGKEERGKMYEGIDKVDGGGCGYLTH